MFQYTRVAISDKTFEKALPGGIITSGEIRNHPQGIFMTRDFFDRLLRWVMVKGYNDDWAVYIGWADEMSELSVRTYGDKLVIRDHIRRILDISDSLFRSIDSKNSFI